MLSLLKEFVAEFESTWAIILKTIITEGEGKIDKWY